MSPGALAVLRTAALERFNEVLRVLIMKQAISAASGEPPAPARYAEVMERGGGRYDCKHGIAAAPFSSLLRLDGAAARLVPTLHRLLGTEAEVVAMGQVVAMSEEGWDAFDEADVGNQQWRAHAVTLSAQPARLHHFC